MNYFFRFRSIVFYLFITATVSLVFSCGKKAESNGAMKAADALATFQVADGFEIEMIASEPLISDPVDMEIDEYGRMYVVEMHGYPLDKSGSGKIIQLSDDNGDGIMDKRTVFKEGLMLPTGILRWKKGFIVTDAPNILYLEDTNGDGKADLVDTLLTGIALTNPQHNMNNPIYGLDNWIYVAHEGAVRTRDYVEEFGDEGTEVYFPASPDGMRLPVNANGRSLRFRPIQRQVEMMSNHCQFGHTFDAWGHWFGCNNSNQGYHEVISNRYFERNPTLPVADAVQSMSDHLDAAEVFPTTKNPDRQLLTDVGVMTAACGLTAYLGGAFPPPFDGNITFIGETVSNLVHVDVLKDSGASFVASRIFPNKEFLTSTDSWSRPANLYVGPDGALYVLDYYRRVIESPEWMADDVIAKGGLYDGSDMGRIYRITAKNSASASWTKGLKLGDANVQELVKTLANKNAWWRTHAQRLLIDRADKNSVSELDEMATNPNAEMGRLHALWTLEGMGELKPEIIARALKDSSAGIRENAIKLAELHRTSAPQLMKELVAMQNDPNEKVRFQLLLTLGYSKSPEAQKVRNHLLFQDINDKWVQVAALSADPSETAPLLSLVLEKYKNDVPAYTSLVQRLGEMVGIGGQPATLHDLISKATNPSFNKAWQPAILKGLARGMKSRKDKSLIAAADQNLLAHTFFETTSEDLRQGALQLLKVSGINNEALLRTSVEKAISIAKDTSLQERKRAAAIEFVSIGDSKAYAAVLKSFLVPQEKAVVQRAVLSTLGGQPGNDFCEFLVNQWPVLTTSIRNEAIGVFMVNQERMGLLIDALEKEKIPASSVSFPRSVAIMQVKDEGYRNRARKFFTRNEQQSKKVNEEYKAALDLEGDAKKGMDVFMQNCAICHQVRGKMGISIGPDLGSIHNWKKADIMANILDPNMAIFPGFDLWDVTLKDGESIQGIISSETPAAITLRNHGMEDRTVNRQDIESLKSLNLSAMPAGLEKNIDKQAMADLLAYLRQHSF